MLDAIGDSAGYIKGLHSKAKLDPEKRYIVHFPEDNTIMVRQLRLRRKRSARQKVLCTAHSLLPSAEKKDWMAEHMLILGVENPQGEIRYVCGAFPSACGKTNLAMLIPPEAYREKGWKCWTVGDDIAWLRIGPDGRLWAVNPENGFFGVAPGTSAKSNPNALAATQEEHNLHKRCSQP